jgi:uncharacterized membrane protein
MKDFLTAAEEQAVVGAIREAEARTSGEIRVVITARRVWWLQRHARKLFLRLGMAHTAHRNGVLIVLFTRRRRFVVLGDSGLAAVVEPGYWERIASELGETLRQGRKVDALTQAIRTLGATLAAHWPPAAGNPDELPDAIHRE